MLLSLLPTTLLRASLEARATKSSFCATTLRNGALCLFQDYSELLQYSWRSQYLHQSSPAGKLMLLLSRNRSIHSIHSLKIQLAGLLILRMTLHLHLPAITIVTAASLLYPTRRFDVLEIICASTISSSYAIFHKLVKETNEMARKLDRMEKFLDLAFVHPIHHAPYCDRATHDC